MVERAVQALGGAVDPWGYLLLYAVVLLESSAFIGLFVPGETALLLAGVLCQQGKLSLTWCIVIATGGAVVGDSVGYEIGRQWGHRVRSTWLGRKVGRQRWDRARTAVRDKGGRAVIIGRWVGVLRALVPAAAGDAHVDYAKFLAFNVVDAVMQTPPSSWLATSPAMATAVSSVTWAVAPSAWSSSLWRGAWESMVGAGTMTATMTDRCSWHESNGRLDQSAADRVGEPRQQRLSAVGAASMGGDFPHQRQNHSNAQEALCPNNHRRLRTSRGPPSPIVPRPTRGP